MKRKIIHACVYSAIALYIAFWCGVSLGKSLTCINEQKTHVSNAVQSVNIHDTYNYEKYTACAVVDKERCGTAELYGGFADNSAIEVNGVGMFTVKQNSAVKNGCIRIFFANVEDASDFGTRTVYVRRCDDAL